MPGKTIFVPGTSFEGPCNNLSMLASSHLIPDALIAGE